MADQLREDDQVVEAGVDQAAAVAKAVRVTVSPTGNAQVGKINSFANTDLRKHL